MLQEVSVLQRLNQAKSKNPLRFNIRAIIWSTLLLIISGIVGNRSDAAFLKLWDTVTKSAVENQWMIGGVMMISFSVIWLWLKQNGQFRRMQHETDFLLDLNKTLDALLSTTISMQDPNYGLHNFLSQALENITRKYLKDVRRCILFLPDSRRENLTISDAYGWIDGESKNHKTFCIDPQKSGLARGVAGEAFIKRKTIVAHVSVENGCLRSDEACYIPSQDSIYPFCGSIVCMPLLVGEEANDCLGVLCFDSYNQTIFDTSVVQHGLRLLARRISLLLLMHEKFKKEVFS